MIEKRLPFGFMGKWGKLYKLYNFDDVSGGVIRWQKSNYRDIGEDVQFKETDNRQTQEEQAVKNLVSKGQIKIIETSDAVDRGGTWQCVVEVGDIIKLGDFWVVESVDSKQIYTPEEHAIFGLRIKKINGIEEIRC